MLEFTFLNSLKNKAIYTYCYPFIIPSFNIVEIRLTQSGTSKCMYSFLAQNKQLT